MERYKIKMNYEGYRVFYFHERCQNVQQMDFLENRTTKQLYQQKVKTSYDWKMIILIVHSIIGKYFG